MFLCASKPSCCAFSNRARLSASARRARAASMCACFPPPTPTSPPPAPPDSFARIFFFRLNTVEIHVPALRERREDIPVLAAHFLSRYAARYRRPVQSFDPAAMQALMQYSWPGNVRELEHTIERAVLMCRARRNPARGSIAELTTRRKLRTWKTSVLEAVEAVLVRKALQRFQGNVSQAAEALGLSRGALYRRMEKYGV